LKFGLNLDSILIEKILDFILELILKTSREYL